MKLCRALKTSKGTYGKIEAPDTVDLDDILAERLVAGGMFEYVTIAESAQYFSEPEEVSKEPTEEEPREFALKVSKPTKIPRKKKK